MAVNTPIPRVTRVAITNADKQYLPELAAGDSDCSLEVTNEGTSTLYLLATNSSAAATATNYTWLIPPAQSGVPTIKYIARRPRCEIRGIGSATNGNAQLTEEF